MRREFFDPTPEEQIVILVDAFRVREAEKRIEFCERCRPLDAETPFDVILDRITGSDPTVTDYLLEAPAKCPNCLSDVLENTLVEMVRRPSRPDYTARRDSGAAI